MLVWDTSRNQWKTLQLKRSTIAGTDGVHSASWGNPSNGGRAGGRLKPKIKVMIGGERAPRFGGDVVTFEDMREFLLAYSEYEQQMHIRNQSRWKRPGTRDERAARFGDPNAGVL